MRDIDSFLARRIAPLVADQSPPIDLEIVTKRVGVISIEEREMVPEAVVQAEQAGFRIYLQSNFSQTPGAPVRRRFTLAHEIAHTFFFEHRDGTMKPMRGAPVGNRLEAACHKGAAHLLVPEHLLRKELRLCRPPIDATKIVSLAAKFQVSLEVMMRRLEEADVFGLQYAPVLVRHAGTSLIIEYAVYPPWLKAILSTPRRGLEFKRWFAPRGAEEAGRSRIHTAGALVKRAGQGVLVAFPFGITSSTSIFEIRLELDEAAQLNFQPI